jgi:16S rRNA processing protein RimM
MVLLGRIGRAHGLKGEVSIETHTEVPESIASYGPLRDETGRRRFALTIVRKGERGIVARIAGVADRTAAEALRGTELWIERDRLPPPEAGSYYHVDLIGLIAVSASGGEIGRVVAVENHGAGDLLALAIPGEPETELVPFADPYVGEIDFERGRIIVSLGAADEGEMNEPRP